MAIQRKEISALKKLLFTMRVENKMLKKEIQILNNRIKRLERKGE